MKINFEHLDESIELKMGNGNILVVENVSIYSQIMYSLYNEGEYFKIYNDEYRPIDKRRITFVINPLVIDFDDRSFKTLVYNYVCQEIENEYGLQDDIAIAYREIICKINKALDQAINVDLITKDEFEMKDLLKFIGLSVDLEEVEDVFSMVQMDINVLSVLAHRNLLIFMGLNNLLSNKQYKMILDQIEMNNQTVLLIENDNRNLQEISYYCLDKDFFMIKK